jgi:hypothetical protein
LNNKELAVQLFSAHLNASALIASNPNFKGTVIIPSLEKTVNQVKELAVLLESIEDK